MLAALTPHRLVRDAFELTTEDAHRRPRPQLQSGEIVKLSSTTLTDS